MKKAHQLINGRNENGYNIRGVMAWRWRNGYRNVKMASVMKAWRNGNNAGVANEIVA